jgi:hypothetical protein
MVACRLAAAATPQATRQTAAVTAMASRVQLVGWNFTFLSSIVVDVLLAEGERARSASPPLLRAAMERTQLVEVS